MLARNNCIDQLREAGISRDDAQALRRISMVLHRWHELECGDSNNYCSQALVRGRKVDGVFEYVDDGAPFMETHYNHGGKTQYIPIADRERGALKRLAEIVARYPGFGFYVQGDPRGASLYIMRPGDVKAGESVDSVYTRGIAVYK